MAYKPSRLVERAWATPPRCLAPFCPEPLRNPPNQLNIFDDLGFFRITCPCGGLRFKAFGYPQEDGFFASPLKLACTACNRESEIFDIASHGYDAELGNRCSSTRGAGERSAYQCPSCQSEIIEPLAGFSYQIEPIEDMSPGEQQRLHDLFDWFYLEALCVNCRAVSGISDYECA